MSIESIVNLCVLVCAAVGFGFGVMNFLVKRTPLYAKMITGAVACAMLARLLEVVRTLAGFPNEGFQLYFLSFIGVFMFFLTANAGLMDGLADDGSKELMKYRLIPLAAPCVLLLLNVPIAFSGTPLETRVSILVMCAFMSAASYFNLKHAIFPDVEYGVIACVRWYNWCALAYAALHMLEMVAISFDSAVGVGLCGVLLCVDTLAILPCLKRGIEQWQI
jgi:hypothetical protein